MAATPSDDGCAASSLVSVLPPALTLIATATTLLLLTCTMTHVLSGSPLSQLGLRPAGRGLWTYLAGQLSPTRPTGGIRGTWGYDSSLGSHSPAVRVLFHICAYCMTWAALLVGPAAFSAVLAVVNHASASSSEQQQEQCNAGANANADLLTITSPSVLSDGIFAAAAYFGGLFLYHMVTPGVSHPGGPREHKIRRMPQWDDITSNADQDVAAKSGVEWRCAVADDSHNVTLERFGVAGSDGSSNASGGDDGEIKLGMTGEPSGRQMWTWSSARKGNAAADGSAGGSLRQLLTPTRGKKKAAAAAAVNEDLVQEMACGGRSPGFNPSVNPNR